MKEIETIQSPIHYNKLLKQVSELMDKAPKANSENEILLRQLVSQIQDYEKRRGWEIPLPLQTK